MTILYFVWFIVCMYGTSFVIYKMKDEWFKAPTMIALLISTIIMFFLLISKSLWI